MTRRITEEDMAVAVRRILLKRPRPHQATFAELRDELPRHIRLSRADKIASPSRPAEQLWHQIVRNLIAHAHDGFEPVEGGGVRLTAPVRKRSQHAEHRV